MLLASILCNLLFWKALLLLVKRQIHNFSIFISYLFIKELTIYTQKMFLKSAIFLQYILIPLILGQKHFGTLETEQPQMPNNTTGTGSSNSSEKSPPYYG
jgi:hypothetical protein